MAISIDDVYQKVLSLANKEQRGYITPQEFNLFADKAQKEIFENYFHDMKTAKYKRKNHSSGTAFDEVEMLQEKLHPFQNEEALQQGAGLNYYEIPSDCYHLNALSSTNGEITEVTRKEVLYIENNPLLAATTKRMNYVREDYQNNSTNYIRLYPAQTSNINIIIHYWRLPVTPNWAYVVVNEKALFNANLAQDFELHFSEEEHLVTRILQLSGITIKQQDIQQAAIVDKQMSTQDKNN